MSVLNSEIRFKYRNFNIICASIVLILDQANWLSPYIFRQQGINHGKTIRFHENDQQYRCT